MALPVNVTMSGPMSGPMSVPLTSSNSAVDFLKPTPTEPAPFPGDVQHAGPTKPPIEVAPNIAPVFTVLAPTTRPSPDDARDASAMLAAESMQKVTVQLAPIPPTSMTRVEASEQARVLWSLALDAEGRREFRLAVASYEQIERLPHGVQQSNLKLRLQMARMRAITTTAPSTVPTTRPADR